VNGEGEEEGGERSSGERRPMKESRE